jgi:hypothetical protein
MQVTAAAPLLSNRMQQSWDTIIACNQRSLGVCRQLLERGLEARACARPFLRHRVIPEHGKQLIAVLHGASDEEEPQAAPGPGSRNIWSALVEVPVMGLCPCRLVQAVLASTVRYPWA